MIGFSALFPFTRQLLRKPIQPDQDADLKAHLQAAADWIVVAHEASKSGGISKGYSWLRGEWAPAYPETTGYTIPTLLNLALYLNRPDLHDLAISLAKYLLHKATPDGAVVHWQSPSQSNPIVFDTGQVIFGWLAAFDASQDERYLEAAVRAGKWLVKVQDHSGCWINFQYLDVVKVIDTRVSWALLELFLRVNDDEFIQASRRNIDWAISQQNLGGWFDQCVFTPGETPPTHTLAYTAEGLLESGFILNEPCYTQAGRLTADALLNLQRPDGSLAGSFSSDWHATEHSSCLTGNCQMSCVWLNLYELTLDHKYLSAASKSALFVASTQDVTSSDKRVRGAIAGSYPFYGRYERFKFPNWAVKFFIDAVLALIENFQRNRLRPYKG